MFAGDIAEEIESKLSKESTGLLRGGSSYSNNYGGGADDVHFCATSFGWSEFLGTINPFQIVLLLLLNVLMFVRITGLVVLEFFLATIDFIRGISSGRQLWQELIMIPARMVVVVLLRELVTIGASYDAARGLPIIHLNLLGYDEQAHRRGPESRFAHWTLRGIDSSIRKVWNAAHLGAGREYDVWVYSDHGQESTTPYELEHGKLVQQVVADTVEELAQQQDWHESNERPSVDDVAVDHRKHPDRLPTRADWIGFRWLVTMLFGEQDHDIQSRSRLVQTVTSGPVGFVYLLTEDGKEVRAEIARRLVSQHVPMCAFLDAEGKPTVLTPDGSFDIDRAREGVFGCHPFKSEILTDLVRLVHHQDSGEILIFGWNGKQKTNSFVLQQGAHAGPGDDETGAFALLPSDTLLPDVGREFLRPNDLRLAALRILGRDEDGNVLRRRRKRRSPIRLMTYNVHACVGMDGQLSPERIARLIQQSDADIICLQELDVFRCRSGNRDQAHAIAQHLEMDHQFHPAWALEEEQFGNAILTRFPMQVVQKQGLHHHKQDRSRRSALWVEIEIDDATSLQVINTHLSIYPQEQRIQSSQLIEEWVQPANLLGPVILCGDFNARPGSKTHRILSSAMRDVESFDRNPTRRTLFSPFPLSRVDHGFVSHELVCTGVHVFDSRLARIASDHLPLAFDLKRRV